jgi:hypothetical protein
MSLQLYESLSNSCNDKDLTIENKKYFIKNLPNLDNEGMEILFILIVFHMKNTENKINLPPYKSIFSGKDLEINLENLPNKLKNILYKFLNLHLKKIEEDRMKNN